MVHGASGIRWYLKPAANRGPSSVCFAYRKFNEDSPTLPYDQVTDSWMVYNGKEFAVQESLVTMVVPMGVPVPQRQLELLEACKINLQAKAAELKAKVMR